MDPSSISDLITVLDMIFPRSMPLSRGLCAVATIASIIPLFLLHKNQLRQPRQPSQTAWLKSITTLFFDALGAGEDLEVNMLLQPDGDGMHPGAIRDKPRTLGALGNVIVFRMGQRREIVGARLDGRGLEVGVGVGRVRLDEADMVEKELVAVGRAEHALLEEHADFRRGAVHVVGVNLNDDRHVMRRAAFIGDVLHDHLFVADARALVDGALDGVFRDAFLLGLFNGGEQARIHRGIRPAHLGGDGNFANKFSGRAAFFEAGDQSFGM